MHTNSSFIALYSTAVCLYFRYTREAGVRALERKIGAICRAVAVKVAEGHRATEKEDLKPDGATQQGGRGLIAAEFFSLYSVHSWRN